MGPNLRRLFRDRKDAPYPVAADANGRLIKLFNDHGEALIARVGELADLDCYCCNEGVAFRGPCGSCEAKSLLAQLETEAQP